MTTATAPTSQALSRPASARPDDDKFVPLAAELGARFAERAAEHDRENTFVEANYALLRESGYTALAIPEELGGLGASLRQVCYAQAELARYCGATALAVNMHIYLTLTNMYRYRNGAAPVEALLRRVAAEKLILMTSGGSDGIWPSTTATRVEGGYTVNGRKSFCSQAPIAASLTTLATYDDPDEGRVYLAMGIPSSSPGFQMVETWDTLGMRGSGSHDVQLDDVFVADAQVVVKQPWGKMGPVLRSALIHAGATMGAVYFGIAAGARDEAVRQITRRRNGAGEPAATDPSISRLVGLMDAKLKTAWWALIGSLTEMGDDYQYATDEQNTSTGLLAKRYVVTEATQIVDLAMEAVGGSSFFKRSPLERAYRDVRGGPFHPLPPEKTLQFAGRLALGQPVNEIW
jgi:acyl-CoA dehydrogenase